MWELMNKCRFVDRLMCLERGNSYGICLRIKISTSVRIRLSIGSEYGCNLYILNESGRIKIWFISLDVDPSLEDRTWELNLTISEGFLDISFELEDLASVDRIGSFGIFLISPPKTREACFFLSKLRLLCKKYLSLIPRNYWIVFNWGNMIGLGEGDRMKLIIKINLYSL